MVESQPSKLLVAGSIPVSRSILRSRMTKDVVGYGWYAHVPTLPHLLSKADVAQLAERVLGKDEVTSSILVVGSRSQRAFA